MNDCTASYMFNLAKYLPDDMTALLRAGLWGSKLNAQLPQKGVAL